MGIFSICVSGWEEYMPVWFRGDFSVEEFTEKSREAIRKAIDIVILENNNSYVSGHDIIDVISPIMESFGFERTAPEIEIDIEGECLYTDRTDGKRPKIFDDEMWNKIISHNKKIDEQ